MADSSDFPDYDSLQDFEEMPNDHKADQSNEAWHAMDIVAGTIKHVDEFKF